ncbi:MAG: sugar MFS transporter [Polyangiales bacterium]
MATPNPSNAQSFKPALVVLTSLFFMWGLITSLNDILVPHLKTAFTLTYVRAMLIQFCFFGAYFVVSLPAGFLVERIGYRNGIIVGLLTAGLGCVGFYPAALVKAYPLFLAALFVLACGITLLQVAANPYVSALGPPETSASRLNLTQAFNSLGTTLGPLVGSAAILGLEGAEQGSQVETVRGPYLGLAALLALIAFVFSRFQLPAVSGDANAAADDPDAVRGSLWQQRHLILGTVGIFVYVGAEVSIGSFLVGYMAEPGIAGLSERAAGSYLAFYWGGAMVGRFIGSALLQKQQPGRVLAFNAACAAGLLLVAMGTSGLFAMWSVLAIGLFNSIMFPTIFTLAIARLGKHTGEASGVLCMAIVGGAIVPLVMGFFADRIGVHRAYFVPALCYAYIVYYGLKGSEVVQLTTGDDVRAVR